MIKGFVTGVLFANAFEWAAHKYVLHGTPRKGQPRFSPSPASMDSHWTHHRMVRKTEYQDECYTQGLAHQRTRLELLQLALVGGGTALLSWRVSKGFALASVYAAVNYYRVHSRSHVDPNWAKKRIPWHYDHHMNTIQDANWCVTRPWFDYVMGTREASSLELMESNPLGIWLSQAIERPLNAALRRAFPQTFERVERNICAEQERRRQEADAPLPELPAPAPWSASTAA